MGTVSLLAAEPPSLTLPRVSAALKRVARIASGFTIAISLLVLLGWWWDIEAFKRILRGLVAMNPTTAVTFIALALSLVLVNNERAPSPARRIAKGFACFALLIGLAKLIGVLSSWDPGVDRILFQEKVDILEGARPNRMAPNTALNFLLLGAALLILDRRFRRDRWPAQFLTVVAAMSSLLALIGYAYGIKSFYGIGAYIPMALHTAGTFLVLSIGILCARPTHGITAVISSNSAAGMMIRRLLPAVIILPVALGWLRLAGERAHMFDHEFGLWLLVVLIMSVFAILVGWNGKLLFRSDIERTLAEERLTHQATHDALTTLPNRMLFLERLKHALADQKSEGSVAVLFIDLDRFKVINDSLGHAVGDELLVAAGERIRSHLRGESTVARLGGDEFTVLLTNVDTPEEAKKAAERIGEAFHVPFMVGPHEVFTTTSIGIAVSEAGISPTNLIRHADISMYRAKGRGKARCEVFDGTMDQDAVRRLQLEMELRRALDRGELRVYYQPEVEIETGYLVGMEALVRWEHPDRGLVPPTEFIAVAEETGLILPIGRWVLYEACRQAKEWQDKYRTDLALLVAVNLSAKHFQQANLIEEIEDVVEKTGITPSHLILEITETVAMEGGESTIEILRRLSALGVLLAIDDFGTGLSSLSYLKRFPVDILKIDKSFVDGLGLNDPDTAIVQAVIALGHALGLKVIAEGVETSEQLAQLRALGSEMGQGFFFAAPLSGDLEGGMPTMLSERPHWIGPLAQWKH